MISNVILITGLLLVFSYYGGKIANNLNFPRVTGYLCAGILLNPSVNPLLDVHTVTKDLHVITDIALGVIAYSIGGSLEFERIRHLGHTIGCISLSQAVGAALVTAFLVFLFFPLMAGDVFANAGTSTLLAASLVIGAISAATAPGAVLAIVSEMKAKGDFAAVLLGVIALDDAITIIFFALASVVAFDLINPSGSAWMAMLYMPFREIAGGIITGMAGGYLLNLAARGIKKRNDLLMVVMGGIFVLSGITETLHFSRLIGAMTMGITVANMPGSSPECFNVTEVVENGIFGLFFSLAGAYIDIRVIQTAGLMALALLVFRFIGKHVGTWAGAVWCNADSNIKKYLSLALFPQAGVTIGLILMSEKIFPPEIYKFLLNAVIGSVVINEILAPPLVKFALERVENNSGAGDK